MKSTVCDIKNLCLYIESLAQTEGDSKGNDCPAKQIYAQISKSYQPSSKINECQFRALTCELFHEIVNAESVELINRDEVFKLRTFNDEAFTVYSELNDVSLIPVTNDCSQYSISKSALSDLHVLKSHSQLSDKIQRLFTKSLSNVESAENSNEYLKALSDVSCLTFSSNAAITNIRSQMQSKSITLAGNSFSFYDLFMSYFDARLAGNELVLSKHDIAELVTSINDDFNIESINKIIDDLKSHVADCTEKRIDVLVRSDNGLTVPLSMSELQVVSQELEHFTVTDFFVGPLEGEDVINLEIESAHEFNQYRIS